MALKKEDLQAIGDLMDSKIEPLTKRMDGFDKRMDRFEEVVQTVHESQILIESKIDTIGLQLEYLVADAQANKERDKRVETLERRVEQHDTRIFKLEHRPAVGE